MADRNGNKARLRQAAGEIIGRLLAGEPAGKLAREFRVANTRIAEVIYPLLTSEQLEQLAAARRAHRIVATRAGQFRKGHVPWCKGRRGIRLSPATEFKAGCLRGNAARLYRPVGTVTVYHYKGHPVKFVKVADSGRRCQQWIPQARWVWQQAYGPLPAGRFVVHRDGDTLNDELSNLVAVDRAGHLALQMARDPAMLARRKARSAAANRGRHRIPAAKREAAPPRRTRLDCPACGFDRPAEPGMAERPRCPKCGATLVEVTVLAESAE
jgi:hypothetical protein